MYAFQTSSCLKTNVNYLGRSKYRQGDSSKIVAYYDTVSCQLVSNLELSNLKVLPPLSIVDQKVRVDEEELPLWPYNCVGLVVSYFKEL